MSKIAPPKDQRPEWYEGYVGDNEYVLRAWKESLPSRSHNHNLRTDGQDLWSWDTRIGRTHEGRKQLLDVRGPKAFISHTTSQHVNLAEPYADELVQPVIVQNPDVDVTIGRTKQRIPDHWSYFPGEGYGDVPTDQTDYKVVIRMDMGVPVALFPEEPMDAEGFMVKVYDPRKGVYAGNYDEIMDATTPARSTDPRVYRLLQELVQRGYTYVKQVGRATDRMKEIRAEAARQRKRSGDIEFDLYEWLEAFDHGVLTKDKEYKLFQHLVDTGLAWDLPARISRHALDLIESGKVMR